MPAFTCCICGNGFRRQPSYLKQVPQPKCCSNPCKHAAMARGLLVLHPSTSRRRKYVWEPWQDDLLRRTYTGKPGDSQRLAAQLRRPRHAVKHRAQRLGLSKGRRPWTVKEETFLRRWIGRRGLQRIAKQLGRSLTAVTLKAKRLALTQYGMGSAGYTATGLAHQLGYDAKVILRWIAEGKLRATRRETARLAVQGGDVWRIEDAALRAFVLDYPECIDLRRLEPVKEWFLDLVTDGEMTRRALQALRA